jgi:hypothetical protein
MQSMPMIEPEQLKMVMPVRTGWLAFCEHSAGKMKRMAGS